MKRLISFIIVLVISLQSSLFACGPYWPSGDDIRFSMLNPRFFDFSDFDYFNYTAELFSYDPALSDKVGYVDNDENIMLWKKRCKNIPSFADINAAIYELNDSLYYLKTSNTFAKYLFQSRDKTAIDYIDFAKKCSPYNQIMDDPWERHDAAKMPVRIYLIQQALKKAKEVPDHDIQTRYAFIAIRLASYNGDTELVNDIFKNYFEKSKIRNIIYYWALYFKTLEQPSSGLTNYQSAIVFSNAPDKRFMISFEYKKTIPIDQTLRFAKNSKERAAIYLLNGIKSYGQSLTDIQSLYQSEPGNRGLGFLILREINKIEDWLFTPYYTNYSPSLYDDASLAVMNRRIARDKIYMARLFDFINTIDIKKVHDPLLIKTAKAYLSYMSGNYGDCMREISAIRKKSVDNRKLQNQLNILQALCTTKDQQKFQATISVFTKKELMRQYNNGNYKFIFAIARELEYKGNTTDAAILLSTLPQEETYYGRQHAYWTKKHCPNDSYPFYYSNYFPYIDEQYTAAEVEAIISEIKKESRLDSFTVWKLHIIKTDLQKLYDLVGTKYLRTNNLKESLAAYQNVTDTFWLSDQCPYKSYLGANPFYTNFYNEHATTQADTITFTKTTLIKKLLEYLAKADDLHNGNRDYYYFLVANCYFNMTQYGNSWIMKRYSWSTNKEETLMPDNKEYFTCDYAKQYYLKAKETSKNKKFAALCLRMAARCETYKIEYNNGLWDGDGKNPYYSQLKKQYPHYYDDLVGNCESFETYLKARK